jgi:hypothetical protein
VLTDDVSIVKYNAKWQYKCPTGSDNWIETTNQEGHVVFVVWGNPRRVERKIVYEYGCDYCKGLNRSNFTENICDKVLAGIT